MKILKPGKVEQRKFVCADCGCVFVAHENDKAYFRLIENAAVRCPTCGTSRRWDCGEPYEEPTPTQTDRERLIEVLHKHWAMDDEFADRVAYTLIAHGVTFREG